MNTLVLTPDLTLHPEDINDPERAIYVLQHDETLFLSKIGVEIRRHPINTSQGIFFKEGSPGGMFTLSRLVKWLEALADEREAGPSPTFNTGLFEIRADEIDAVRVLKRYDDGYLVEWWSEDGRRNVDLSKKGGATAYTYEGFFNREYRIKDPDAFVAWLRGVAAGSELPAPTKPARPSFDDVYAEVARVVARRASCDRAQVGAVLVDSLNRIIATGYNGAPRGLPSCDEVGHLLVDGHCLRTIHAEANALMNAVADPRGSTLYVTHYPCIRCANLLVQAGVVRVVAREAYGDTKLAAAVFEAAGVKVEVG